MEKCEPKPLKATLRSWTYDAICSMCMHGQKSKKSKKYIITPIMGGVQLHINKNNQILKQLMGDSRK